MCANWIALAVAGLPCDRQYFWHAPYPHDKFCALVTVGTLVVVGALMVVSGAFVVVEGVGAGVAPGQYMRSWCTVHAVHPAPAPHPALHALK
jgi:hypothetical protein